ncbi:DUF5721 family protein [Anaerosporobacter faecicola]|uniref:DUF5721 family protein n=1 Tax=Anaerosporobacter faecicola TaxID=2718714 RepID=UPI00143C7441|nr:DUF5721 family protein [Anaerosporobacter faecicola]
MVSLHVVDVKTFMNQLLIQNVFDNFLLSEMEITTFNQFKINGNLNLGWFDEDEKEELQERRYSTWAQIKPIAFSLMKGKKVPSVFKIVLLLSPANTKKIIEKALPNFDVAQIGSLYLNIRYENGSLHMITGTSMKIFTMDKSVEQEWDSNMKRFLKHYEVVFEEE